jgi:hypothetical protein
MNERCQPPSIWVEYWNALGGWDVLKTEVYFLWAVVLTVFTAPFWLIPGWWDTTTDVLAILVGFSVSIFAVALTLAERMGNRMFKRDSYDGQSPLLVFLAGYIFYILLGFVALAGGVISEAWYQPQILDITAVNYEFFSSMLLIVAKLFWCLCGLLFWYCLTLGVRTLMSVFRLAGVLQLVEEHNARREAARVEAARVEAARVEAARVEAARAEAPSKKKKRR